MSDKLLSLVRKQFGKKLIGSHSVAGDATVLVERDDLVEVMTFLRDDARCAMEQLVDVTAVDWSEYPTELRANASPCNEANPKKRTPQTLPRFEAVYHLLSLTKRHRLRVKVPIDGDDPWVPTMCDLWIAANWGEREAWDMTGVRFEGHPNLQRILTYDGFQGHPLRKDFPQRGYQPLLDMPTLKDYADHPTHR